MNTAPAPSDQQEHPASENSGKNETFVFLDRRGKRWPRFRRIMFAVGTLFFVGIILFVQTLVLPSPVALPPSVEQLTSRLKALQKKKHEPQVKKPLWLDYAKGKKEGKAALRENLHQKNATSAAPTPTRGTTSPHEREIRLGFFESWDPDSLDSLKAHATKLTHLCPDWLTVVNGLGDIHSSANEQVLDIARSKGLTLMPLLRNLGEDDDWLAEAIEGLINGPMERQNQFLAQLIPLLKTMQAGGVVLDWQKVDPTYKQHLTTLLVKMAKALHEEQLELWITVPSSKELEIFEFDILTKHVDRFVAMLHDENGETDSPGPIASVAFFNGWLSALIDGNGKPSQWIISLGAYGYDWTEAEKEAQTVSFQDVMSRARRSSQAAFEFHQPSFNPTFIYEDAKGARHTIWFLDAITFLNQLTASRARHVGGIAISRMGTEDPDIWDVLDIDTRNPLRPAEIALLETIESGPGIAHVGKGNLITIDDQRTDGTRRIRQAKKASNNGLMIARYESFPAYLTILHQGRGPADAATLTFDDGPDDEYTPPILDILKSKGVKATFFMLGLNMEKHPALVERILKEGHAIGIHTYTHPNIALVSEERARLELNATQHLIESITGRSSILFRPPYSADTNPHEPEELVPIRLGQKMGYITVTEDIDPEDWAKPGVQVMLDRIKLARMKGGNVVLLHDAGGDRQQTIQALPQIIDYLIARGDRVVPLSEILGIPEEQLMPPVPELHQPLTRKISDSGFKVLHQMANFFWAFMIVATGLTIMKTLTVSWLAIFSRAREKRGSQSLGDNNFLPPVSVLIAAFNEEKVIRDTLRAVLNTHYPGPMEIVVVDDGSKDATSEIVLAMGKEDARIRLIRQENGGKAVALRTGLNAVQHEIVVCLDADTQFTPDTIGHLVRPFVDPKVGAVSGRARVGNPKTMFARFQSLEYTCGFNLDRRAYHQLDCITVVPGAVSALRASAIREAGGISTETLAEDTDLTLAMHKCGHIIWYAPQAIAWTEAPETLRAFAKQRFRWAFGTLQCLWKHRELLFNTQYRALGWFSLPSAWFFNIFLVAFGSVIDLLLLLSLLVSPANPILYFYFFIFLIADLLLAAVASLVEGESLAQTWLVLPMRFVYRPVLNYVVVKAIVRALKGVWVGWGKLDRTASVPYKA